MRLVPVVLAAFALVACQRKVPPPPKPDPHFVLGDAYQVKNVWFYPHEAYDVTETGLADVLADPHAPLTTNGEVFDAMAMAGAHPTIQLPAIARVTNLENGRSITVRINDRGSGNPHRLIELTKRAAQLLEMTGPTRARVQVLPAETHAAVDAMPGAPKLAMTAAPRAAIEVAELPPPPGTKQRAGNAVLRGPATKAEETVTVVPERLPETVTQGFVAPGRLLLRLDTFREYQYAAVQRAKMFGYPGNIVSVYENRTHYFRVDIGPLKDVREAETAQDQAFQAGIPDARIVVD